MRESQLKHGDMHSQALTTIGDAAEADANKAQGTAGRRLAQMPAANDPNKPAQPFGYR